MYDYGFRRASVSAGRRLSAGLFFRRKSAAKTTFFAFRFLSFHAPDYPSE
jgi:hypothetical protein